ncbi:GNAT family protein [Niabella terrae]
MIPKNLSLETERVLLRPVTAADYDTFLALSAQDDTMWEYFSSKLSDPEQLQQWMQNLLNAREEGSWVPFAIIDKASGQVAGSSSLLNISWHDKRLEIGASWLGPAFRSTGVNRHAKFAMMRYAIENLKFERVEFKTGVLNHRARRGLEKIGGVEEGTLRSHSLLWNGQRRTSVYYSVLKEEWQELKKTIFADIL